MPWLFKGKGDIQFDVYRNMRNATKYVCMWLVGTIVGSYSVLCVYTLHANNYYAVNRAYTNPCIFSIFIRAHWEKFTPYTNVLWINYLTTKTKIKGKLKGIHSKVWESKFKPYLRTILKYKSVKDVFLNVFYPDKPLRYSTSQHDSSSRQHPV